MLISNELDDRIIKLFANLQSKMPISNGNSPLVSVKFIDEVEPILSDLKNNQYSKYYYNADFIVNLFSTDAVHAIMDLINSGSASLLVIHIENYSSYSNRVIDAYKYLFEKLSKIEISRNASLTFNENKKLFNSLYDQLTKSSGACYIATMAYGDYDHPQVIILREFRDNVLYKSILGKWVIKIYYRYSPKLVNMLKGNEAMNGIIRKFLNQFIKFIK